MTTLEAANDGVGAGVIRGDSSYQFRLDHASRMTTCCGRIDCFVTPVLAGMHERSEVLLQARSGRPSVDPALMIRMLIVGYSYGLRSERRLTQEVELHLAYRRNNSRISDA